MRFVITTSIGLPHKAHNLRRTPRVAMLYSDATGSGLASPPAVLVQGPAGLLCHRHNEQLWGLRSFLLRGTLQRTDHDWVFRPRQLVRGMDTTPLSNLRLLRNCRRTAKRYLAARGLPRPTIPWEHYARLKDQASGRS